MRLASFDGPSALEVVDVPEPPASRDRVLIDVRAIGVNFPDLLATKGQYQHRPELPFIPGCEVAGIVREAPADGPWAPGDRVAAFTWEGGYAEQASVAPAGIVALPGDAGFDEGAAMVVNYHTVFFALARRGRLRAGERLLVMGAAGGIGTAAVQVGCGMGASVIAGVADGAQVQTALDAGAEDAIVLGEGFSREVLARTDGRGVDVVIDPLGDRYFDEAVRTLAPEGRILVIGFAAGEIPSVRVNRLLLRNASAVGVAWGAFLDIDPSITATAAASLDAMFARGIVRPQIGERVPFEGLPAALSRLGRGEIRGKAVAVMTP